MAKLNSYLNFDGQAEEAFNFYKSIFGGDFVGGIHRMGNAPGTENISEDSKNRVMHIALPIGGDLLMASDIIPEFGQTLVKGNHNYISVFPDSREEANTLFKGFRKAVLLRCLWKISSGAIILDVSKINSGSDG